MPYQRNSLDIDATLLPTLSTLVKAAVDATVQVPPVSANQWENCIANQSCAPTEVQHPRTLGDLVQAVKDAKSKNLTIRPVGSGHSYSDVALTEGILLQPQAMNKVLPVDASLVSDASTLFSVQSGITIAALNQELDKRRLALVNMPAYDGQTLAGAISTGTHGTGASFGPLASMVRSLVLVTENGDVVQIEPTAGITDPAKFAVAHPNVVLKQDDDWFQSNVVAMGCMGIVYSYTLEVTPAYYLAESRTKDTWDQVRSQLPTLVAAHRHVHLDVNPYSTNGAHTCIVTTRDVCQGPVSGKRAISGWLSGLLNEAQLTEEGAAMLFNASPELIPGAIDKALGSLTGQGYVDKSFKVLNLDGGDDAQAYAVELAFDAATADASIDALLSVYAAEAKNGFYQTGPISIRFIQGADAYLAPQHGRVTCMAELDMIKGTKNGDELLKRVQAAMVTPGSGARVHWGLELASLEGEQVAGMYPKYEQWLSVYRQSNMSGMFNNRFTERMGISV